MLGERLARYGFRLRSSVRPGPARRFRARVRAARAAIRGSTLLEPRDASIGELQLFHTPEHMRFVMERSQAGNGWLDGGDTPAFRGVFEAAPCVVGSSLEASAWILDGTRRRAFVPIGGLHHAARSRAAGFCVFNDCGVVIEYPASAPTASPASPMSTSTRITAMACSTPSRTIRSSSLPTCTRVVTVAVSGHRRRR